MIGFLVVDKEAGWTSHDVVARSRKILGERRIGHAGTLDPGATGLLVLGVGRATRLLGYLSNRDKEYRGEVVFGVATTTFDDEGEVTGRFDMTGLTIQDVRSAAQHLVGSIDQQVPMVSAVKVGGRRLHALARAGVVVERPIRRVRVERLEVDTGPEPLTFAITVRCSSGTYVRSLAADLGAALGGGAHLRRLRRTALGPFQEADARTLEAIQTAVARGDAEVLYPVLDALDLERVTLDDAAAAAVSHGRPLSRSGLGALEPGPVALLDRHGELIAVYECVGDQEVLTARVVLAPSLGGLAPRI